MPGRQSIASMVTRVSSTSCATTLPHSATTSVTRAAQPSSALAGGVISRRRRSLDSGTSLESSTTRFSCACLRGIIVASAVPVEFPGLKLVVDDARSWFARSRERFDLIQMSLIDTWAATGAGGFTLSENGLYTTEGWLTFLKH